jgi:oligoendopeptidase F
MTPLRPSPPPRPPRRNPSATCPSGTSTTCIPARSRRNSPLEFNRIDDAVMERALAAPRLAHYRPWVEDLRKEKPYQLEDRVEQLFHEKSVTGARGLEPAVRRDHFGAALHRRRRATGDRADAQSAPGCDEEKRKAAAEALARVFKENLRLFTLITNTLAKDKEISDRWRGFKDIADSRHLANRVEPETVDALVQAVRVRLSAAVAPLLQDEGAWFGKEQAQSLGPQRAAARGRPAHDPLGRGARHGAHAYGGVLARDGEIAQRFFDGAGSTRRCGRARRRAPSRIRPCRRCIPMCCSTTRASRAT